MRSQFFFEMALLSIAAALLLGFAMLAVALLITGVVRTIQMVFGLAASVVRRPGQHRR